MYPTEDFRESSVAGRSDAAPSKLIGASKGSPRSRGDLRQILRGANPEQVATVRRTPTKTRRAAVAAALALIASSALLARDAPGAPPARDVSTAVERLLAAADSATRDGRWGQALAATEEALTLDPANVDAHTGRLLSLLALGRYPQARQALGQFGDAAPARALDVAGHVLRLYGDLRGARRVFERCVDDLQPRNPFCWAGLVDVLLARGEDEEAMRRARAAFEGAYPGGLPRLWEALRSSLVLEQDRERIEKAIGRKFVGRIDLPSLATPLAKTDLPLQFENGWPLVPARLDGRPARFVVDTGADHLSIRRSLAARIGLRITGKTEVLVEGGTGTVTEDRGIARELRVGNVVFRNVPVNVSDDPLTPGDGVLGVALLKEFLVDLDFPGKRMRLRPGGRENETALGPMPPGTASIPFVVLNRLPVVPGRINGRLDGWFLLDTGAQGNVFNSVHLHRLELEGGLRQIPLPDPANPGFSVGVGGRTAMSYLGALRANLGPYVTEYTHVPAVPFLFEPGVWTFANWGMEHLKDYRIVLDYRGRRLLVHSPMTDDKAPAAGIVHLDLAEPEIASRLGLL